MFKYDLDWSRKQRIQISFSCKYFQTFSIGGNRSGSYVWGCTASDLPQWVCGGGELHARLFLLRKFKLWQWTPVSDFIANNCGQQNGSDVFNCVITPAKK